MKNKIKVAIFMFSLILIFATNCEKEERYQRRIVDVWNEIKSSGIGLPGSGSGSSWRFDEDNKFYRIGTCDPDRISDVGTYKIKDDTLFIDYKTIRPHGDTFGIYHVSKIYIIDRIGWNPFIYKTLKIETMKGEKKRFRKCTYIDFKRNE